MLFVTEMKEELTSVCVFIEHFSGRGVSEQFSSKKETKISLKCFCFLAYAGCLQFPVCEGVIPGSWGY